MATLDQLHHIARDIFDHALAAVDPISAVERAIKIHGSRIEVCGDPIEIGNSPLYAIAIGKAASSMATGLCQALGDRIVAGMLIGPALHSFDCDLWRIFDGGHPLPTVQSLAAAQAAFALLDRAEAERANVIALISGGGSAMLEWPTSAEITLEELRQANQVLVHSGASINEINVVRRSFSAVKGGGLARRAPHAQFVTLVVSDTNEGDEASVASGPTLVGPAATRSAFKIVMKYRLESALPSSILKTLETSESSPEVGLDLVYVLLNNQTALRAAAARAQALGFNPVLATEICEQPIADGCNQLIAQLESLPLRSSLISGGEFACPVRGDGRGGRNLETTLRCAQLVSRRVPNTQLETVLLSAGTDGIDGNSPAAGAIADGATIARAKALGLSAQEFLDRSDSFAFFEKLGDAIITGQTGTNVRDVRVLLKA